MICLVKVRYLRNVARARPADSRFVRNTVQASAIVMSGLCRLGFGLRDFGRRQLSPVHEPAFSYASAIRRASSHSAVLVVLRENLPASVPDIWIWQRHLRPHPLRRSSSSLGARLVRASRIAIRTVAAIEVQRQ